MPKSQLTPASALQSCMDEYQLNPFSLSKKIGLSNSSIRQILNGKSGISVPTALRLAKFFGQSPVYWLDIQLQADLKSADNDKELQKVIKGITKAVKPSAKDKAPKAKAGRKPASVKKAKPGAKPAAKKAVAKKTAAK